ncbi:hypothetical protein [Litchfieldia alkalitelluris]|nr:hypothetical protein [Litchfieldia alkalitelluris]
MVERSEREEALNMLRSSAQKGHTNAQYEFSLYQNDMSSQIN